MKTDWSFSCFLWGLGLAGLASLGASTPSIAREGEFLIHPYLFSAGAGGMQLAWQYEQDFPEKRAPEVTLFQGSRAPQILPAKRADSSLGGAANYPGQLWIAALPIPLCGSQLRISYQVTGMKNHQTILSPPCPQEEASARFSFIADAQQNPGYVETLSFEINQFPGSALLSAGDLVHHGALFQDWVNYFGALNVIAGSRVMLPAIGNHEYRSTPATNLWQQFFQTPTEQAHYSYFLGSAHVIVLNSCFVDDPAQIDGQLPWLVEQLSVPASWKIVMFHHPPFSRSIANLRLAPKKEWLHLQTRYVPLFEAYGVDVVLAGHTHIFERSLRNGIQYLTAGPAGGVMGHLGAHNPFSLRIGKERTVTHFELTPHDLDAVTLNINGERIDSFHLSKAEARKHR